MLQFCLVWFVVVNKDIVHTRQDDEEVCINQLCQALRSKVLVNNSFNTSKMAIVFLDDRNPAAARSHYYLTLIQKRTDRFNFLDIHWFW